MSGINKNIYFQQETYNQLVNLIGKGKLSKFVNEIVEEKLIEIERNKKEKFRQELIAGYKEISKDKELNQMLKSYGESSWEDISTKLTSGEKIHEQRKK
jgi:chromosome condensin MukBEF MukE localization factor